MKWLLVEFKAQFFVEWINADPKVREEHRVKCQVDIVRHHWAKCPEHDDEGLRYQPNDDEFWTFLEMSRRKSFVTTKCFFLRSINHNKIITKMRNPYMNCTAHEREWSDEINDLKRYVRQQDRHDD